MHALTIGFGLGFLVALQLGPMSLFLIRSTLRRGWAVGLAIGAGVAVIDAAYATLGAAGAVPLLTIGPLRVVLGVAGGAVLIVLGARTLWSAFRVRTGGELDYEVSGPRRAFDPPPREGSRAPRSCSSTRACARPPRPSPRRSPRRTARSSRCPTRAR